MSTTLSFGAALSVLRERAKLTQAELAERAETHTQSVSELERGTRLPRWDLLCRLADALAVPLDAFRVPGKIPKKSEKSH